MAHSAPTPATDTVRLLNTRTGQWHAFEPAHAAAILALQVDWLERLGVAAEWAEAAEAAEAEQVSTPPVDPAFAPAIAILENALADDPQPGPSRRRSRNARQPK